MRSFSSSLCLGFLKIFLKKKLSEMPLEKNDSLTKKKILLLLLKDISKRGVNVKCPINEKQRRRIRVVLNGRVLRASTREEDVTMRVKGLIVAYGRRT